MILVRRIQVPLAVALAVAVAAGAGLAQGASRSRTVKVTDSVYTPKTLTVRSGTRVVWRFDGSLPHNVEVTRGPELFSSSIYRKGSYSRRLRRRGTYRIVCTLHTNMRMRVIVR